MARYTAHIAVARHGLVVPVSLGTWLAPDEPDLWVASLAMAGWPVRLSSVVVHLTPAEFLHCYQSGGDPV